MKAYESLKFGYHAGLPKDRTAAWGARAIFGSDYFVDLLWDRQDVAGDGSETDRLLAWLNEGEEGRGKGALDKARNSEARYGLRGSEADEAILYEDEVGIIKANTNASYGYLYMVAYLKEEAT